MGGLCGNPLPEYDYKNMDSREEQKFIDAQQIPTGPRGLVLCEQLEIFIACSNLPKLDIGSPSDPFIVIYQKSNDNNKYVEIAKTEMVKDNNNPDFNKPIIIDYHFEEVQFLRLDIYDADSGNLNNLSKHDFIGRCEFVLADLVNQNGSKFVMQIKDKKNKLRTYKKQKCLCIVRSEEIKQNFDQLLIQFECRDLAKIGWSKPNPYLQLYRKSNSGDGWMSIMRTKRFIKTQSCKWNLMKIPIQRLCNGDYSRAILIKIFHDKNDSAPIEIGQCSTSLQALLDETNKPLTKDEKVCGTLIFSKTDIIKRHGFLEYVMGGMNIQLMVGIDFTGSNGDPQQQDSLHYIGQPNFESPYMRAIRSVGRILESYDSDKQINAYGFGANINPFGNKNISHCFNLSLTEQSQVNGIEGVLQAYVNCMSKIQLYGPTNFSEIINTCSSMARSVENNEKEQNYIILLMITDGLISDMKRTVDAIVSSSSLPISIIIVGVGNADFSGMEFLDADDKPLKSSQGMVQKRDIVQFVPFNKYKNGDVGALAKAVLNEVPAQITGFMTQNKLHPLRKNINAVEEKEAVYAGPSTMVRSGTDFVQNMQKQPINPYYPQMQPAQQPIQQQQMVPTNQPGFNPAAGVVINPTAPSAPLY